MLRLDSLLLLLCCCFYIVFFFSYFRNKISLSFCPYMQTLQQYFLRARVEREFEAQNENEILLFKKKQANKQRANWMRESEIDRATFSQKFSSFQVLPKPFRAYFLEIQTHTHTNKRLQFVCVLEIGFDLSMKSRVTSSVVSSWETIWWWLWWWWLCQKFNIQNMSSFCIIRWRIQEYSHWLRCYYCCLNWNRME